MTTDFLFFLFAAFTIFSAMAMILNRNAVNSAMFMILTFVGMAGLFVLLEAFFLGVLQILVYAGAIMVLFLFIIMLLDVKENEKQPLNIPSLFAALIGLVIMIFGIVLLFAEPSTILNGDLTATPVPELPSAAEPMEFATKAKSFGYGLFTKYMLPFQMTGVLLLIAMVGVIILSKKPKHLPNEESES